MKHGIVYLWFDRKHKRYYLGSHWGTENDGYICSSRWMRNSYKRRPQDFKRRILLKNISNEIDTRKAEHKLLQMIKDKELGIKYYNHFNFVLYYATSEEISKETKKAMWRPDVREKYLAAIKDRVIDQSEEVREKRRVSMIKTMEEKFPIDERHTPRWEFNSVEYKENMAKSVSLKWKKLTTDEKLQIGNKISESLKDTKELRSQTIKSLFWWTDGTNNKRSKECPGDNWYKGRSKKWINSFKNSIKDKPLKGKLWWNNGLINTKSIESPGEKWIKGKLPHNKSYNSEKMKDIWDKRKAGILPIPEYGK